MVDKAVENSAHQGLKTDCSVELSSEESVAVFSILKGKRVRRASISVAGLSVQRLVEGELQDSWDKLPEEYRRDFCRGSILTVAYRVRGIRGEIHMDESAGASVPIKSTKLDQDSVGLKVESKSAADILIQAEGEPFVLGETSRCAAASSTRGEGPPELSPIQIGIKSPRPSAPIQQQRQPEGVGGPAALVGQN